MIERIQLKEIKKTKKINEQKKNVLRNLIIKKGFQYKRGYIVISKDNKIIDGNYRYQACLEIYGKNAYIRVRRKKVTYFMYVANLIFYNFLVIGLFILLLIYLWI